MKKLGLLLCVFFLGAVAATAQTWAVAVNTADAVELGTIGIEGSAAVGQHWSIHAGAKVNPWTFGKVNKGDALFQEPNPDQKQNRKQREQNDLLFLRFCFHILIPPRLDSGASPRR